MNNLKLVINNKQAEKFDSLLYWLTTVVELEGLEFNNQEEGLNYIINLVVDRFGSSGLKARQEEINFLKLVFETDEQLLEELNKLLKVKK